MKRDVKKKLREKKEKDQKRGVLLHQVCNLSAFRAEALSSRFFKVYFKSFEAFGEEGGINLTNSTFFKVS